MSAQRSDFPRICLFGDGAMSRRLQSLAQERGVNVTVVFRGDDLRSGRPRRRGDLRGAEVGIDFSGAATVVENVRRAVELELPLVEGTTGWKNAWPEVEAVVLNGEGTLLHAPNFSFSMNVLFHLVAQAADLFETAGGYDPYIVEHHHAAKADAPSGTALRLGELLLDHLPEKDILQVGAGQGRIAPNQLSVAAVRAGFEPGRHQVGFDGPFERLEFVHTARDRGAFAEGALQAAAWLRGRSGIFTLDDVLRDILDRTRQRKEAERDG